MAYVRKPTGNQLKWLFDHEIPISMDLTFEEASFLISDAIEQQKKEYDAYVEKGIELKKLYTPGVVVVHPYFGEGIVLPDDAESKATTVKINFYGRRVPMYLQAYFAKFTRKDRLPHTEDNEETPIELTEWYRSDTKEQQT